MACNSTAQAGWSWRSETVIMWDTPNGCSYTGQAVPIGNACRDGVALCAGAKIGISGAVVVPSSSIGSCAVYLYKDNTLVAQLGDRTAVTSLQCPISAPYAYTIQATGVYKFSVVYWNVGAATNAAPYGGVLDTNVQVNVYSSTSDPQVTTQDANSFFQGYIDSAGGTMSKCFCTGSGVCTFIADANVNASIYFVVQGGNANGVKYTALVEKQSGSSWQTLTTKDLGTLTPGTGWVGSLSFTIPSSLLGEKYRISVTYPSVAGGVSRVSTSAVTLYTKSVTPAKLEIQSVTADPISVIPGSSAKITIVVRNTGGSPSGQGYYINLTAPADPGWEGAQVAISSINAQTTQSFTNIWYRASAQAALKSVQICATISK